jgi:hypothetical protein
MISTSKDYATHDKEANVASELFFDEFKSGDEKRSSQRLAEQAEQAARNTNDYENDGVDASFEDEDDTGHESILWTILLHLIKFLAEVCV